MKPAVLTPRFREQARALPKDVRREIGRIICEAEERFGNPRRHGGVGMGKLRDNYHECRVGWNLRLVFAHAPEALNFEPLGDHREMVRFLRGL